MQGFERRYPIRKDHGYGLGRGCDERLPGTVRLKTRIPGHWPPEGAASAARANGSLECQYHRHGEMGTTKELPDGLSSTS